MTAKGAQPDKIEPAEIKETTFTCRYCGEEKPLTDMVVLSRFFPPVTVCRGCAVRVEYARADRQQEPEQEQVEEN